MLAHGTIARRAAMIGMAWGLSSPASSILYKSLNKPELRLSSFNVTYDGSPDGYGTDNLVGLRAFLLEASSGRYSRIIIDRPRLGSTLVFSGSIDLHLRSACDLTIDMEMVDLVCTRSPGPKEPILSIRAGEQGRGDLVIRNAMIGMGRPCGRVAGHDLVRLEDFSSVDVDFVINCSDNMGVTIQRDSNGLPPQAVRAKVHAAARQFRAPHLYAAIGDTALWLPNGSQSIDLDVSGSDTGDDFVYVGPTKSNLSGAGSTGGRIRADISNAATGVKIVSSNISITGSVKNTVGPAIAIIPGITHDQNTSASNCSVSVQVDRGGQLEAGSTGQHIIPLQKQSGSALWIYGNVTNTNIDGCVFSNLRGGALLFEANRSQIAHVHGRIAVHNSPVDPVGRPLPVTGKTALVRRSGTPDGSVVGTDIVARTAGMPCPASVGFLDGIDHHNKIQVQPGDRSLLPVPNIPNYHSL